MLHYALGIWPSRDNVWTNSSVRSKRRRNQWLGEPMPETQALLAVLAGGPFRSRSHCHFVIPTHPLHTRITNMFGASFSETTMRPNFRSVWAERLRGVCQPQLDHAICPGPSGPLSALGIFHSKSVLCGAFVWARRVLNSQKRRFLARAVPRGRCPAQGGQARHHARQRDAGLWLQWPSPDGQRLGDVLADPR
jgi:hypothetical protein